MTDCRHGVITTFAEANGPHRMWACEDCRIRFYPACRTCVDVGHRFEEHEPSVSAAMRQVVEEAATVAGLDSSFNNDGTPVYPMLTAALAILNEVDYVE